jgi:hypothetical protein
MQYTDILFIPAPASWEAGRLEGLKGKRVRGSEDEKERRSESKKLKKAGISSFLPSPLQPNQLLPS